MRYFLQKIIYFYQIVLSPVNPCVCRFHPSCSAYSMEAIQTHGPIKGLVLIILRLARCNPLFRSGLDPVPQRFSLNNLFGKSSCSGLGQVSGSNKSCIRSQGL